MVKDVSLSSSLCWGNIRSNGKKHCQPNGTHIWGKIGQPHYLSGGTAGDENTQPMDENSCMVCGMSGMTGYIVGNVPYLVTRSVHLMAKWREISHYI